MRFLTLAKFIGLWLIFSLWPAYASFGLPTSLGDLDEDQQATVTDLIRLINHKDGSAPLASELAPYADLDRDGNVTQTDVDLLARAIVGAYQLPLPQFPGAAGELLNDVLPDIPFAPEVFEEVEQPDGIPISTKHLIVAFTDQATVGEVNELLDNLNASVVGSMPDCDLVKLRMSSLSLAELLQSRETLSGNALIAAVSANVAGRDERLAGVDSTDPVSNDSRWSWELGSVSGEDGNYPWELSRVPQMWNLMDFARRQKSRGVKLDIAAIDARFYILHEDMPNGFKLEASHPNTRITTHGSAVIGIMAADHTNNRGVAGVYPLADQVIGSVYEEGLGITVQSADWFVFYDRLLDNIIGLLDKYPNLRVINISLGMPYYFGNRDPETDGPVEALDLITWGAIIDGFGDVWKWSIENYLEDHPAQKILIFVSAGNDSARATGGNDINSRYNSPMANVAIRYPSLPFFAVEALDSNSQPFGFTNRNHESSGSSISAGGRVLALAQPNTYTYGQGTSFASPFVAGVAGWLWQLDSDLSVSQVKQLLAGDSTSVEIPPEPNQASNMVDGFAASIGIDALRNNNKLQKALVDVDDGTMDGNLRKKALSGEKDPDSIHTSDKRRGDGVIDMKDFRVFRDAWLQATNNDLHLDGPSNHFKRDLNFDGAINGSAVNPPHPVDIPTPSGSIQILAENVFPRYDFNGNGKIDEGNYQQQPPADAVAPFKHDPDDACAGLDVAGGCLRDIDVMLKQNFWMPGEENVQIYPLPPSPQPNAEGGWTASFFTFPGEQVFKYLWSADFHFKMEGAGEFAFGSTPIPTGGVFLQSATLAKSRQDEWEGVLTMPFERGASALPPIQMTYGTVDQTNARLFSFEIHPKPGEDFRVELGMNTLALESTIRGKGNAIFPSEKVFEVFARANSDVSPFDERVIPNGQNASDFMDDVAREVLLPMALTPGWHSAEVEVDAAYDLETNASDETIGKLTGASFTGLPTIE
jgi:hypothetical protein